MRHCRKLASRFKDSRGPFRVVLVRAIWLAASTHCVGTRCVPTSPGAAIGRSCPKQVRRR